MLSGKRSQAELIQFFAFHLAAMLMFIVIVVTLMSMDRDLQMSAKEFQVETQFYAMFRRLISTSDCLAHRESEITYDEATGSIFTGREVFLGLIDEEKYNDSDHFNCMRMDFIGSKGMKGSGLSVIYEVALYDLKEDEYLHDSNGVYDKAPMNYSKFSSVSNDDIESCKNASSSRRQMFPIMIKRSNGDTNPGFMYLKICSKSGAKYDGQKFCQKDIEIEKKDIPGEYVEDAKD